MEHSNHLSKTEEIERLRSAYQLLAEREQNLRVLHSFALNLLQQHTLQDVVWAIVKHAIAKLGFFDCVIYLLDEQKQILVQAAAHGPKNPHEMDIANPIIIPLGRGIVGSVAETRVPEIISDTSQDSRYILDDDFRYSEITVPILDGDRLIGIIDSEHPEKNFFTQQHLELLQTIAAMAVTKILHAQAVERLRAHQRGLEERIEEQTRDLKEHIVELRKSNQDLEGFAYAASHDLAEPLRTISSFLQLIQRKEKGLSGDSLEYMDFAIAGVHRLRRLLDGLLIYARVGQKPIEQNILDLNSTMLTVQSNLSQLIKEKKATIQYDRLPNIPGDESSLIQLFQNLITNAIKFHHKERPPSITITHLAQETHHQFSFQDNGIGMEEIFFEKAFKLFGRLHTIQEYKGSGLGLALCKRVVENHGGEIWLDSQIGIGTTVHFTLQKSTNQVPK
ncbi:MAG: GAF domain-containing protein [Saprospiraceae bacterium]|nr:GAF domain-containing protein [Saprospiraceae bacterium]